LEKLNLDFNSIFGATKPRRYQYLEKLNLGDDSIFGETEPEDNSIL